MGQVINVDVRREPSASDVRYFEMDRSLTGMGLKEYFSPQDAKTDHADDELAKRLFEIDGVRRRIFNNEPLVGGFAGQLIAGVGRGSPSFHRYIIRISTLAGISGVGIRSA